MFNEFEITVYGGFAIVTLMMWFVFCASVVFYAYRSKLLRPLRKLVNSLIILIKPRKQRRQYLNLYNAGYIYKWSANKCLKKWDRGL